MNEDILKGKWRETRGFVREIWCRLTENPQGASEGRSDRLLGQLQKNYGYLKNKSQLEYEDGVELARIVSLLRHGVTRRTDVVLISFVTRYARPLLSARKLGRIPPQEGRRAGRATARPAGRGRRRVAI